MAGIRLQNLSKRFPNGFEAVKDLSLEIADREFLIFVGPSGCGKTTTLRMIAGLEEPSGGEIFIDGKPVKAVAPKDRDIAMVFQNYALYPHMTIYKNMAIGLTLRKVPKPDINRRVRETAKMLGIDALLERKPKQLSGGECQRVAMGRAIVREPKAFLMDEPLSNLDAKLRVQMRAEISKLYQKLQTTFIYVTHDQTEAMTLGTRIAVMKDGVIQQIDAPLGLYNRPSNLFVAGFIGSPQMNFFEAVFEDGKLIIGGRTFPLDERRVKSLADRGHAGKTVTLGIRPSDIHEAASSGFTVPAIVELIEKLGSETYLYLSVAGIQCVAEVSPDSATEAGDKIEVSFDPAKTHLFGGETGNRIGD